MVSLLYHGPYHGPMCRGSIPVTESDFHYDLRVQVGVRTHYSLRLNRGTGLIRASRIHPLRGIGHRHRRTSLSEAELNIKAMTECAIMIRLSF